MILRAYTKGIRKNFRQCPQIGRQCGIKNKAAIAIQCKSNVKLIVAVLFIPHSSVIWRESQLFWFSNPITPKYRWTRFWSYYSKYFCFQFAGQRSTDYVLASKQQCWQERIQCLDRSRQRRLLYDVDSYTPFGDQPIGEQKMKIRGVHW